MSTFFELAAEAARKRYEGRGYAPNYVQGLAQAFALGQLVSADPGLEAYVSHLTGYAYTAEDLRQAFINGREWCNHDAPAITGNVCECGVTIPTVDQSQHFR